MKKMLVSLGIVGILLLVGCSSGSDTEKLNKTISSLQTENSSLKKELENVKTTTSTTRSDKENKDPVDEPFTKITKNFLNGTTWYEGNTAGIENQPRQGFADDRFQDIFGNSLNYELTVEPSKTYTVLDYRKNVTVEVDLATKIKVNQPSVNGIYHEATYFLYYKYDGTLMIVTDSSLFADYQFTSYPLERISN